MAFRQNSGSTGKLVLQPQFYELKWPRSTPGLNSNISYLNSLIVITIYLHPIKTFDFKRNISEPNSHMRRTRTGWKSGTFGQFEAASGWLRKTVREEQTAGESGGQYGQVGIIVPKWFVTKYYSVQPWTDYARSIGIQSAHAREAIDTRRSKVLGPSESEP